ncbi:MAG TPA: transposase [Armatimonadota bacterium]|nr:transposase [Armatimonadota bacterium]
MAGHGGTPYIPFKSNMTGGTKPDYWQKMHHFYACRRDEFLTHYHRRSNMESTVSMIKTKFGDALRSKTDIAQENEVLCKVLCHNLCVLIQSFYEFGIDLGQAVGLIQPAQVRREAVGV